MKKQPALPFFESTLSDDFNIIIIFIFINTIIIVTIIFYLTLARRIIFENQGNLIHSQLTVSLYVLLATQASAAMIFALSSASDTRR